MPDEEEGKILRVRMVQKEDHPLFDPVHLFDEGSTISWIPCGRKLTCSFPGIKFNYGPDEWCVPSRTREASSPARFLVMPSPPASLVPCSTISVIGLIIRA